MKVYIWGTGHVAEEYLASGEIENEQIIGFIQTEPTGTVWREKRIYRPSEIANTEYDYILVCVYYEIRNILETCKDNGISTECVLFVDCFEWSDNTPMKNKMECCRKAIGQDDEKIEKYFPKFFARVRRREQEVSGYIVTERALCDSLENDSLLQTPAFDQLTYWSDYFRYRSFELAANEILRSGIEGACAEVGVFEGSFSRLINAKFSDRKLYLFDTFSSFDDAEFAHEVSAENCDSDFIDIFKNTSVERVMGRMPFLDKCIFKVGFFPDTAKGLECEKFAFVSLDVDFERSTLEGLKFFYPRMSNGGIIFVHDYNSGLNGVKKAVDSYERDYGIHLAKMPIADCGGSLIIYKY